MKRYFPILALLFTALAIAADPPPVSDNTLYDQVRMKLVSDLVVKGGALEVKVESGVVTLAGRVRTDKAKEKAVKITKGVKGVKSVVDKLTIDPQAP